MNGAPLTRTPPRRSWGRGPPPPGWRRIQARRSTCLLLRAVQRRRVESLVLGALSSSPVHRALVLVLGTNIAVLLDCSKSSRQCSLSYLLTYCKPGHRNIGRRPRRSARRLSRGMESNAGPQQWYGGYPCTLDGRRPKEPLFPPGQPSPPRPPHPPLLSASEHFAT